MDPHLNKPFSSLISLPSNPKATTRKNSTGINFSKSLSLSYCMLVLCFIRNEIELRFTQIMVWAVRYALPLLLLSFSVASTLVHRTKRKYVQFLGHASIVSHFRLRWKPQLVTVTPSCGSLRSLKALSWSGWETLSQTDWLNLGKNGLTFSVSTTVERKECTNMFTVSPSKMNPYTNVFLLLEKYCMLNG